MAYTPPTLAQLRDKVEQDLRDSSNEAFSTTEVDDLINEAIVEINRLYPLMQVEDVDIIDTDSDGNVDRTYTVGTTEISRAEVWRDGEFRENVPIMDGDGNSGLDLWGTTLTVPSWLTLDETQDTLKLYGYADRDYLDADADVAETDAEAEFAIRTFCQLQGYQRLQNDRSLFQQWLRAPGNNEMSPNQLDQMVNTYVAQWERKRATSDAFGGNALDLSRDITYRSVNINSISTLQPGVPMSGYLVNDARFADVEGWGYREKRSQGDGYDVSRVYMGMRRLMLRGTIFAQTKAELHDKVRTIRALFTPTLCYAEDPSVNGFLPLTFDIPTEDTGTWATGYIPVKLNVRPKDQPGFFFLRDMANGKASGGFSMVYEVYLAAADPRFYAQSTTDITCTATTGSGTATNDGDYPAPLQTLLSSLAASTGASSITLTGFGTVMTVTIPASTNDRTVRVDAYNKVVTLTDNGVETLRMDLVSFAAGYTWPEVQPGDNVYSWTGTGSAPAAGSKFWFYETFA